MPDDVSSSEEPTVRSVSAVLERHESGGGRQEFHAPHLPLVLSIGPEQWEQMGRPQQLSVVIRPGSVLGQPS